MTRVYRPGKNSRGTHCFLMPGARYHFSFISYHSIGLHCDGFGKVEVENFPPWRMGMRIVWSHDGCTQGLSFSASWLYGLAELV